MTNKQWIGIIIIEISILQVGLCALMCVCFKKSIDSTWNYQPFKNIKIVLFFFVCFFDLFAKIPAGDLYSKLTWTTIAGLTHRWELCSSRLDASRIKLPISWSSCRFIYFLKKPKSCSYSWRSCKIHTLLNLFILTFMFVCGIERVIYST